jgi:PAS domain S-box-containing protein
MRSLVGQVALVATVLDDAPIGFAVFDHDLRFLYVNRSMAAVHGLPAAEHIGRTIADLAGAARLAVTEPSLRQVLLDERARYDAEVTAHLDGGETTLLVNRYPVQDPAGRVIGVAVTVQDLTEQRRLVVLEEEAVRLRQAEQLAHRLEAAHDAHALPIRNPWPIPRGTGDVLAVSGSIAGCRPAHRRRGIQAFLLMPSLIATAPPWACAPRLAKTGSFRGR